MLSTFTGIEMGKRSVQAHNQALTITGHNLSNASTEGYSRQRVNLEAFPPIYMPQLNRAETPGQIGQGVTVASIERIRDGLLEGRIVSGASDEAFWETRDPYVSQLEKIYHEPSDSSLRAHMDRFWDAWQELSLRPQEMAARQAVLSRAETFLDATHDRFARLQALRTQTDVDLQIRVKEVNDLTAGIAALNADIMNSKAIGDNPNDLMDRRDLLVEKLSKLVDVTIDTRDPDEFMVHTAGHILVQGHLYEPFALAVDEANDGMTRVTWEWSGEQVRPRSGAIASLLQLRDGDIRDEIQSLDVMALTFMDLVNEVHRGAYGLNGKTGQDFFVERPFIQNLAGNYDRDGDGEYDSTWIYRMTGVNGLDARASVGLAGTIRLPGQAGDITVDYFPTDTVEDIVNRINSSGSEVAARLDRSGRLELKAKPALDAANPDFVIRSLEDSGEFLSGYAGVLAQSGPAGAYTWEIPDAGNALRTDGLAYALAPQSHPSGWMEINESLSQDLTSIAAGFGDNGRPAQPGDGSAALAIAALRNSTVMAGGNPTFDDYFAEAVARAGLRGEVSGQNLENHRIAMKDLRDLRQSISGVNMDEELSNMIKFQHGYAAAARFITTVDEMLDTIINRMGV